MRADARRVFYYSADASSLGGFIEGPFSCIIPAQASASLPSVGGYATVRTGAHDFKEIVSCRSAYTRVSGRMIEKDGPWSTLATAVVEGLNILEIVTVERLVAQVSVEHPRDGGPAVISFAGTRFEGFRLGGKNVCLALKPGLLPAGAEADNGRTGISWPALLQAGQEQARKLVQNIAQQSDRSAYDWALQRYGWMESKHELQTDGCVLCSLVDGIEEAVPGRTFGHFVEIPDFGRIFLGELLVFPRSIQLNMIRAELGCNVQAQVSASTIRINGTTMPPS
ncbi:MAG: hypothetical protein WAM66_09410 [Acidobacteriaceae bacterium]